MREFQLKEFRPSVVIFEENSIGDSAYILKEGRVEISMRIRGEKTILAELNPVTIFGEMALLSKEKRRTATATTLSRVKVIEIDKAHFDGLVSQSPSIIASILHGITQRFVDTISLLHPGYVERREKSCTIPGAVERRSTGPLIKYDRIKIQLVHPEQRISKQPLSGYRDVRLVTTTRNQGVRVDYFDGEIEWLPLNTIVYVLG
jgi:CRP-like cAMP-binding protein